MSESGHPIRYSMLIQWSEEGAAFLVTLPEWEGRVPNLVTHGDTYEEAVTNGLIALEDLVAVTRNHGLSLPAPRFLHAAA
jgi:predicted RNase H-like HicB family nuclease